MAVARPDVRLARAVAELVAADHDGRDLWYEYHSNESSDAGTVLFTVDHHHGSEENQAGW